MTSVGKPGAIGMATQSSLSESVLRGDPEKDTSASPKVMEEAVGSGKLQELLGDLGYDPKNTKLEFKTDSDLNRIIVRVLDRDSGDVVREIPPEEMLRVAKAMRKLIETSDALKGNLIRVVT